MDVSHRITIGICPTPGCGQRIRISIGRFPGGINDRGGLVIECSKCSGKSHIAVSNPEDASRVESGGRVLATWDDETDGDRTVMLAAHGLSEADALGDTMLVVPAKESDDPPFALTERAIYQCPDCRAELDEPAYAELGKALDAINDAIVQHTVVYLKGYAQKPETVEVALDVPCKCGTHRVSFFRAFSEREHSSQSASDFTLAGPNEAAMLTHIDGVYSRNDCVEMFKKILRRWEARNRVVMLVVPFIGFDFPNREDDKLRLWNMVLGHTDPSRTILVTRKATYTSFKKAARKKGLDLDVLKKYGLLAQLLDQLDTKGALFKTEFHAKFYAAMGPETTEVLSGSFNIHSGEYVENLLFKTYTNAEFFTRYLTPLGVAFDIRQARVEREVFAVEVSKGHVTRAECVKRV